MKEVIEVIKEARWYFGLSLLVSVAVSLKTSFLTGMTLNIVINTLAAKIGLDAVIIKIMKKVNSSSRKINEIHFSQLISDTQELQALCSKLATASTGHEIDEVKSKLANMVTANNNTINSIKLAKNGAENE